MISDIDLLARNAESNISKLLYGEDIPILGSVAVEVVEDESRRLYIPKFTRHDEDILLQFSEEGADQWDDALDGVSLQFDVTPEELYVTSGLAVAELTLAAIASLKGDESIRSRVVKAEKIIGRSEGVDRLAKNLKELTEVPVDHITTAFDHDELVALNQLRYGIGLSLKALGLSPKQIASFQNEARRNLGNILENYFQSTIKLLLCERLPDQYVKRREFAGEVTARVKRVDSPIVEFAVASPMNMSYILDT